MVQPLFYALSAGTTASHFSSQNSPDFCVRVLFRCFYDDAGCAIGDFMRVERLSFPSPPSDESEFRF